MTSEQIIQRLLDEKKITVKEAMVILKDLAKIGLQQVLPEKIEKMIFPVPDPGKTTAPPPPPYEVVVMYGVTTNPYTYRNTVEEPYKYDNAITNGTTTIYGSTNGHDFKDITERSIDDNNNNEKKA